MYAEDASLKISLTVQFFFVFLLGSTSTHWLSMEVNSAASECLFWGEARFAATRCQQGYLNYYFMIASWRFYDFSWETFTFFHHQHFPVSWRLERLIKISHLRELLMIPCCAWARAPRWQWTLHGHRSMSFHVVPCRSWMLRKPKDAWGFSAIQLLAARKPMWCLGAQKSKNLQKTCRRLAESQLEITCCMWHMLTYDWHMCIKMIRRCQADAVCVSFNCRFQKWFDFCIPCISASWRMFPLC
jgi:hypothetical protein